MTRIRIAAVAGVAAATAALAGPADARAPRVEHTKLAVEVTGIQVIEWHHLSDADPDQSDAWSTGRGRQILGFSTRRPLRFRGISQRGRVGGRRLQRYALVPAKPLRPARGSLRRELDNWHEEDGAPVCEGGRTYCPDDGVTPQPLFNCGPLRPKVPIAVDFVPRRGLRVGFAPPSHPWEFCAPDHPGGAGELVSNAARNVFFESAARRLGRLRRGRRTTMRATVERSYIDGTEAESCPPFSGEGFKECSLVEVTVEVRRLR